MNDIDDGGPAFPVDTSRQHDGTYGHQTSNNTWQSGGMTLRDYFAAQAMQGFCAYGTLCDHNNYATIDDVVDDAYEIADAMLKARKEQP